MSTAWRFSTRSDTERVALVLSPWVVYAILFLALYDAIGPRVALLSLVPVAAVGGLTGMRTGLLAGVLSLPLNLTLARLAGEADAMTAVAESGASVLALALLGVAVGWLRELVDEPRREIAVTEWLDAEAERRVSEHSWRRLGLQLRDAGLPDTWAHHVTLLTDQCLRMASAVDGAVRLSWLETASEASPGPVDLNQLVGEAVEAFQPAAQQAGHLLVFEPDPNLPDVAGVPEQLYEVVANLLTNAISFTDNGLILMRTRLVDGRVRLEVQDSGPGIDPDELPRVFDRFYRGRRAVESGIPGTGLGLAIVKETVEHLGGGISVQSSPGEGTVFTIDLPLESMVVTPPPGD
jgi:signal transduction histidine kinase